MHVVCIYVYPTLGEKKKTSAALIQDGELINATLSYRIFTGNCGIMSRSYRTVPLSASSYQTNNP